MARRLAANPRIPKIEREAYAGGPPILRRKELAAPLRSKRSLRIGVQFMGDLFHESVPPEIVDGFLEVIGACPEHLFFALTKRPENMNAKIYECTAERSIPELGGGDYFPNLWMGVSVENQETAEARIPLLLDAWLGPKWVSVEPMLGPVDIRPWLDNNRIAWVVCGGETGPGARPLDPDWARSVRDQCAGVNVPFYFKAWGGRGKGRLLDCWEQLSMPPMPAMVEGGA